jgi:hypothetical protein
LHPPACETIEQKLNLQREVGQGKLTLQPDKVQLMLASRALKGFSDKIGHSLEYVVLFNVSPVSCPLWFSSNTNA